jgi:putative DNA primase/helicase
MYYDDMHVALAALNDGQGLAVVSAGKEIKFKIVGDKEARIGVNDVIAVMGVAPVPEEGSSEPALWSKTVAEERFNEWKVFERQTTVKLQAGDWKSGEMKCAPGVWLFTTKWEGRGDNKELKFTPHRIGGPLYVRAITSDVSKQDNYGRALRFKTDKGVWVEWVMAQELLSNENKLAEALLKMGYGLNINEKKSLPSYIQRCNTEREMTTVSQVGWTANGVFVLPTTIIGKNGADIVFQSDRYSRSAAYSQRGTLQGWQNTVAKYGEANPVLGFALSTAFVPLFLYLCNLEGGGCHLRGDSRAGKTTVAEAANSIYGGRDQIRTWNATVNGLEAAAVLFNDTVMILDEINKADPDDVYSILYNIFNGVGRQRAGRYGEAREVLSWRPWVISTGEEAVEAILENSERGAKAGQLARLLDIPANRKHGVYDDLCGFKDGAELSNAIKDGYTANHGVAAIHFLEALTEDAGRYNWKAILKEYKNLPEFRPPSSDGQDISAAERFAVTAMAGEVAIAYGVLPYQGGTAAKSASEMFKAFLSKRTIGNQEGPRAIKAVRDFIAKHANRFDPLDMPSVPVTGADGKLQMAPDGKTHVMKEITARPAIDRAGWHDVEFNAARNEESHVYHFTIPGLKEAIGSTASFETALDALEACGAWTKPATKRKQNHVYPHNAADFYGYSIVANKLDPET